MDADVPDRPDPRADYRRLPPRITLEQVVPTQPVARTYDDVPGETDGERQLRTGGAG